jgi:hypothetical protein
MSLLILSITAFFVYSTFVWNENGLIYNLVHKTKNFSPTIDWGVKNLIVDICITLLIMMLSFFTCLGYALCDKYAEDQWEFNINALEDNLVTQGEIHGGMFAVRGYFDGELSYFYSRTMSRGEIIEHIPANKTYLRYDNTVHPKVEVHTEELDIPEWVRENLIFDLDSKQIDYYVMIVPEGTLKNSGEYNIDMS